MSHVILNTRSEQHEQQQQHHIISCHQQQDSYPSYYPYNRRTMYSNRNEINIFVPTIQHYNRSYTLTVRRTKRRIFIPFVIVVVVWMTTTTVISTISGRTCNIPSSKSLSQRPHQQVNPIFRVGNDKNNINLRFCIDCNDGTGNMHDNEDTVVNSDTGCSEVLQQQQQEGEGEREEQSGYVTQRTIPNNNIAIPHGGGTGSVSSSNVSPDSNSSIRDIHDDSNHDSSNNNNNNSNDLTSVSHQILQEFHTEVQQIMKMNLVTLKQLFTNVTNEIRYINDEQRRLSLEQQQQQQQQEQGTSTDTNIDSLNSTTTDGVDVPNTPSNINDSNAIIDNESLSFTSTGDDNSIDDTGNTDEQIPVDFIPSLDDSTNDTITTLFNDTTSIHVDEDIDTTSIQLDEDIESEIDSSIAEPAKVTPTDTYNFDDDDDYLDLDKPIAMSKVSISSSTTTTTTVNGNDIDIVDDLHQNTHIVPKKTTKIGKKKKRKKNNPKKSTIINTPTVLKPKNKHIPFIPTSTTTDVDDDDNIDDLSEIEVVNDNTESEDEIDDIQQQLPTTTEVLHRSLQKLVKSIITSVLFCFMYVILKRFVHMLLRGLGVQLQSSSAIMDPKSQPDGSTAKTILPKP